MPVVFLKDNNAREILNHKEIYIFGAGEKARDIESCLNYNGIDIMGFCVDDEYYEERKSNLIRLSDVPEGDHVSLVYGTASVKRFKKMIKKSPNATLYIWWDGLWQYDESLMCENRGYFARAEAVYADELSRKIMKSYLLGKKLKGNDEEFAYCTEGTYFNELTADVLSGGAVDCGAYTGDTVGLTRVIL